MPYKGEGEAEELEDESGPYWLGTSKVSHDNAVRAAVHAARRSHGTWLTVEQLVESVDDPNVGTYGAKIRETGGRP